MKKTIFLAAILIAALGFTGCGGSDKNGGSLKIDAKVTNGDAINNLVYEVRAVGYISVGGEGGVSQGVTIATAPYQNGGFTITLPTTIDERLLVPIDFEGTLPTVPNLNVSNKDAKGTIVYELLAYKSNVYVGNFRFICDTPDTEGRAGFVFVDGNCKVTGSDIEETPYGQNEINIDLNLKKGWNTVYLLQTRVGSIYVLKITTKKPNVDFMWVFGNAI